LSTRAAAQAAAVVKPHAANAQLGAWLALIWANACG